MHEIDVALTDFALTIECALFALLIWRQVAPGSYRLWLIALFLSISVGALCGGLTHGYFPTPDIPGYETIWVASMLSIGAGALACWNLAAEVVEARWLPLRAAAAIELVAYAGLVIAGWRAYLYVIADYIPAALFLLLTCGVAVRRGRRPLAWVMAGLLLTFVAAAIQVTRIGFVVSSDALYHLVQAAALLLMFVGFLKAGRVRDLPQPRAAARAG